MVRALGLKNGDRVQLELLSRDPCRLRLSLLQAEDSVPPGLSPAPPTAAPGQAWIELTSESESVAAPEPSGNEDSSESESISAAKPQGGEASSESESVAAPPPASVEGGGA